MWIFSLVAMSYLPKEIPRFRPLINISGTKRSFEKTVDFVQLNALGRVLVWILRMPAYCEVIVNEGKLDHREGYVSRNVSLCAF